MSILSRVNDELALVGQAIGSERLELSRPLSLVILPNDVVG